LKFTVCSLGGVPDHRKGRTSSEKPLRGGEGDFWLKRQWENKGVWGNTGREKRKEKCFFAENEEKKNCTANGGERGPSPQRVPINQETVEGESGELIHKKGKSERTLLNPETRRRKDAYQKKKKKKPQSSTMKKNEQEAKR